GPATAMVGVDRVADEEEEVRSRCRHGAKDLVAASYRTAELSTTEVTTPYEADAGQDLGRWRRHEFSIGGHAIALHTIDVTRRGCEARQFHLPCEIRRWRHGDARRGGRRRSGGAIGEGDRARPRAPHPQPGRGRRPVSP